MASCRKEGGRSNIHEFSNSTVVAPLGNSGVNSSDDGEWDKDTSSQTNQIEEERKRGLQYVQKYKEEEQLKISRINLGTRPCNGENQVHGRRGRGRGFSSRRLENEEDDSGRNRGRGNFSLQRSHKPSIYGTIPDRPVEDVDVYAKYDFNRKVFDTSELVINRVQQKILYEMDRHQVMTIEGFTGCGKTTQVPQFILDNAVNANKSCRIAVTQPRRIAAISVANRVANERDWRLGGIVGYQVGMDKRISEDTRLTYMTTGILLQLLIARKSLGEWTHIIIDEVHERDLETDLLLLVIKKIMVDTANDSTRIILMSATLNPDKFNNYFPLWSSGGFTAEAVNIKVDLPNQYQVDELYLEEAASVAGFESGNIDNFEESKIYQECFEMATKIIENLDIVEVNKTSEKVNGRKESRGAVLVFLPGLLEIETLYKILSEVGNQPPTPEQAKNCVDKKKRSWSVLPLHSSITNEEQQRVFIPSRNGFRKIILATNIAESSITVPDIKYVIDFCLTKNLSCDPTTNYTCLRLEWASKNQCIQRRGRCGRVSPGVVYRMVPRKFYETLEQEARPEMLRSSLESVVLQVKLLDMGSPKSVLALSVDPPEETNIQRAVSNLKEIGALTINVGDSYDAYDGDLTFVGRVLSRLPIDIRLGRLILLGHAFDCLEETVIIAAGLSVKSPFAYPYSRRLEAYLSKLDWSNKSFSDCIALLNLYNSWYSRHQRKEFKGFHDEKMWGKSYFVQLTSLREMKVLVDELYKRLKLCGIELMPTSRPGKDHILLLKLVIAGGFYPNYFTRPRPNARDYLKEITRDVAGEDPLTSVVFQGFPMEQPGDLYKRPVGQFTGYLNCVPHVKFHSSRVVVTFDTRGSFIGPISMGVYRAVKLRQLRHILTFATPSRDTAYKYWNVEKSRLEKTDYLPAPPHRPMPGLDTECLQVIVTHIESPNEFFIVQLRDEIDAVAISQRLDAISGGLVCMRKEQAELGMLCVTILKGKHLRGRVDAERCNGEELMIFLIDRGISIWMPRCNVYAVNKEVLEAGLHLRPALAIQCRLKELRPATWTDRVWSTQALHAFEEYCSRNNCQMLLEIYAIFNGVISGLIRDPSDPEKRSVNDLLIEKKFAEKCLEPDSFQDNYAIRDRLKSYDNAESMLSADFKPFEERQGKGEMNVRLLRPPEVGPEDEQLISLRGPHSPLEMTFTALCGSAHLKQVVTDGSSVNSVSLDQDPYNSSSQLLIAANVAIAQRSGNIMSRETTIMPSIAGLTALLTMLFCPTIEFRVDEDKSSYTGCLTGLGIDPLTQESAYPDHDMEVVFDTVIDNEDVGLVNSIRAGMNAVLTERTTFKEVRSLRRRIRQEALRLLERERVIMEEVWPDQTHKWTADKAYTGHSSKNSIRDGLVFPLHEPVDLTTRDEARPPVNKSKYFTTPPENYISEAWNE